MMTKVEEDIGTAERREANFKLRQKIETIMENHGLGIMGDENQLAKDVERIRSDAGLLEYLDELAANGEVCIPTTVLMELTPEERDVVVDKALKCRVFEQQSMSKRASSLAQEEGTARSAGRSSNQLAAANHALLQTASDKVRIGTLSDHL